MEKKKVSVVMCTYNGAKYLREQLDSIINQTYPIHELIIQDDCSTDNTVSIVKEYFDTIQYINPYTMGCNANFFSAMEKATGDYIAISDQDDIWEADKIEKQITSIGDHWLCSGFSRPFSETETGNYDSRMPNYNIERLIHIASALPGHTMLIKRDILPLVLKLKTIPILYDHLISIIAGSYRKIIFVDKVLVNHRMHQASATFTLPVMNPFGKGNNHLTNIIKSTFRTLNLYIEIKPQMREWFKMIHQILKSLPTENAEIKDALEIAKLQSNKGFINHIKLTCLYVKLRRKIFHVEEKSSLLSVMRAIYYPISCSDYFRYMSKKHKR